MREVDATQSVGAAVPDHDPIACFFFFFIFLGFGTEDSRIPMLFEPEALPPGTRPFFEEDASSGRTWTPVYRHGGTFGPDTFCQTMTNFIENPNLNTSWLFRADILYDNQENHDSTGSACQANPVATEFQAFRRQRTLVRKLIPRNEQRDAPLDQTCAFYQSTADPKLFTSLVVYTPHCTSAGDFPFYHPKVRGVAHLHEWNLETHKAVISVHFLHFPCQPQDDTKLARTAYHLLEILHKHGHTTAAGYVKRVHHDVIVPRPVFQDRFAKLKTKYARSLIENWAESTDPDKHVFEDLSIAAFLIELWADMYKDTEFPGFVDIGCGNGLLVYILTKEGYSGWGFDARARKSWKQYQSTVTCTPSGSSLETRLLLPSVVSVPTTPHFADGLISDNTHDGRFTPGTFIISNHADELTPWTPILATLSSCPFIMIPCCSHNLTGEKWRAPPPRDKKKPKSTYASLVDWVTQISEECGWAIETEMLRIPSTRNTGLLGRKRTKSASDLDLPAILEKFGGIDGFYVNMVKLLAGKPPGH
ncbi:tRNA (Uracil-O(2)-)-methyltransferase [Paramyrothecium foliicola]|nr:tRNA (Uracil-O(2)-)-methyltransferase [Paramyrothecium foliicola]